MLHGQEDLSQFHKMAKDPIPVAAIKRRGLDALRDVLNDMKVAKEVVKDGFSTVLDHHFGIILV